MSPGGWPPLLPECYFINVFISLLVLKLGVVELVLQNTGLGGVGCAVDAGLGCAVSREGLERVLQKHYEQQNNPKALYYRAEPFPLVFQVSILTSLLQPNVFGQRGAVLAVTM